MLQRLFTLIISIPILFISVAQAQENESSLIRAKIKHGSMMLGGNLQGNYYLTSSELGRNGQKVNGRRIDLVLRAKNGYFVREDLAVGLDLSLLHESTKIISATETPQEPRRETFMLAGPFVRYYLINGVFGEVTALAGLHNLSSGGTKYNALEGGVGIGYAYFINQQFSLEPVLSFRYFRKVDEDDRAYSQFGPMLGFGLQAYLFRQRSHIIKRAL